MRAPCLVTIMRARRYPSPYNPRPIVTNSGLDVSRVRNHTPERPPTRTYVRTFNSGIEPSPCGAPSPAARVADIGLDAGRKQRTQRFGLDGPVREEHVVPAL